MHTTRFIAGAVLGLAALGALPSTTPAQDAFVAPTYSRTRMGAEDWHARGGGYGYHGHGGYGHGYGYFQPYISPVIAGSWYARPYPYHFDYFRDRWAGPSNHATDLPPSVDCPCALEADPVPSP